MRSRRTIRPRRFYGDTPTPSPPQLKQCSRNSHLKPLRDFINTATGKEYNNCEACRKEIASAQRRQLAEIQEIIQCREEDLERAMGAYGRFNITSF